MCAWLGVGGTRGNDPGSPETASDSSAGGMGASLLEPVPASCGGGSGLVPAASGGGCVSHGGGGCRISSS